MVILLFLERNLFLKIRGVQIVGKYNTPLTGKRRVVLYVTELEDMTVDIGGHSIIVTADELTELALKKVK